MVISPHSNPRSIEKAQYRYSIKSSCGKFPCPESRGIKIMAMVSIIKATYSAPRIESLLEPLGGMERFIEKDDRVLLKVNLLSARKP